MSPARRFAIGLGACVLVGLGLRLAAIGLTPVCDGRAQVGRCYSFYSDSLEYVGTAESLAEGRGFRFHGVETAHHPPAYSAYLAAFWRLGVEGVTGLRMASAALGAAVVGLVGLIGRRVAGPAVGIVAAAIAAVSPSFWINDIVLMSEPMSTLAACLCVLAGYRLWDRRTLVSAVLLGAAGALAALSRGEGVLIVGIMSVALLAGMHELGWKGRLRMLAAVGATGAVLIAPWLLHNAQRFEERTVLTTTAGQSLFLTQRPTTFYGPGLGWKDGYRELNAWSRRAAAVDESQLDDLLATEASRFADQNVGRLPVVMLARFGRQWGLYRPLDTIRSDAVVERRWLWPSRIGMVALWVSLPLAALGGVELFRRRVPLSPLLSVVAASVLLGIGNFGSTRYRAGAEVALAVLVAVALVRWAPPVWRRVVALAGRSPAGPGSVETVDTGDRVEGGAPVGV